MSFLDSLFGSKPSVPTLPPLSLPAEQNKAIAANQQNLQGSEQLTARANQFTQQQIQSMLEQAIPGFSQLTGNVQSTINSELAGQLPADVQQQIESSTAASAVAGGYAGSDLARNLTARDLGITSLNLTQQGLNSAQSWIQQMNNLFSPGMLNVSSMFITPGQQASFDVQQQEMQFQRNWMQNQINAMPDPVLAGIHNTIMAFASDAAGVFGGRGGGGGFGGGAGGSGGFVNTDYNGAGGVSWIGDYGAGGSD